MRLGLGLNANRRIGVSVAAGLSAGVRALIHGEYYPGAGVTLNGSTVQVLADQSGKGDANRNLSNVTASAQPTYVASNSGYNGQATLSFDGGDVLISGTWASPPTQPFRYYWVGHINTLSAIQVMVDGLTTANAAIMYENSGGLTLDAGAGVTITATSLSSKGIVVADFNTAGTSKYAFSAKTLSNIATNLGAKNNLGIRIGGYAGGGLYMTGTVAHVLVVASSTLTGAQHNEIMDFLGARYSITVAA